MSDPGLSALDDIIEFRMIGPWAMEVEEPAGQSILGNLTNQIPNTASHRPGWTLWPALCVSGIFKMQDLVPSCSM